MKINTNFNLHNSNLASESLDSYRTLELHVWRKPIDKPNHYVLKKNEQEFDQMDYFQTIFMNSGTPQMRPDKCRIKFYLEAHHPIITEVDSKQKTYY